MANRISRGAPVLLSVAQQTAYIRAVESDPALLSAVETILGINWEGLTPTKKVAAYRMFVDIGLGTAPLVASARARAELISIAEQQRDDLVMADRLRLLERENQELRDRLEAALARLELKNAEGVKA